MSTRLRQYSHRFGPLKAAELYARTKVGRGDISVELPHLNAPLLIRASTSDRRTFDKIFVGLEYDIPLLRQPKLIIDAGANVGYASVFFAARYPDTQIIAIEPDVNNFRMLERNTCTYRNVRCLQRGVWNRETYLRIENPADEPWAFQVVETDEPAGAIHAVTLATLLRESGADRIDLLKIDVEGAEREIFSAPDRHTWLNRTDVIVAELHESLRPGCERAIQQAIDEQKFRRRTLGENVVLERESAI